MHPTSIRALVFDAYGTLFAVHSVEAACERAVPGRGRLLSHAWRRKQLEYSWLRALMGRYRDFWQVTAEALEAACAEQGLDLEAAARQAILDSYERLALFPEVREAVASLRPYRRVILSNGAPEMLRRVVAGAGLQDAFEAVLSADEARSFKPDPRVYALALEYLDLPREEIVFVSANAWDAAGARAFGFRTCWLNRAAAAPEDLGQKPDLVVRDLAELAALLGGRSGRP